MIVLIDSWVWIEYLKGSRAGKEVTKYIDGDDVVLFSAINLAEVYRWLLSNSDEKAAEEMKSFMLKRGFLIPVDAALAVDAAKLKVKHKMGLADAIVLASARSRKATIVTGDDDFKGLENVFLIHK